MKRIVFALVCIAFSASQVFAEQTTEVTQEKLVSVAPSDAVLQALSQRHFSGSIDEITKLAGGTDALVGKLLSIRKISNVPFAPVRAEKLLLNFADRLEVRKALEADLQSDQFVGLAQVVTLHVDKIENAEFRSHVARLALSRASRDADFQPYARALIDSVDPQVRKLAREKFD